MRIFFNRGSVATQEYAPRFQNRQPDEAVPRSDRRNHSVHSARQGPQLGSQGHSFTNFSGTPCSTPYDKRKLTEPMCEWSSMTSRTQVFAKKE
jgi:hypothetical protein